jgi:hypothetical protein
MDTTNRLFISVVSRSARHESIKVGVRSKEMFTGEQASQGFDKEKRHQVFQEPSMPSPVLY